MNKDTLQKLIGSIGKASTMLTANVQKAAVGCIEHAVLHGDVTLADHLVDALGSQGRRDALRAWFELNGPMFIAKGTKVFGFDKTRKGIWDAEREEQLMAKPWTEGKREPEVASVLDFGALADKFLERLTKQANESSTSGTIIRNKAVLDVMVQAVQEFHAKEILKQRFDVIESE